MRKFLLAATVLAPFVVAPVFAGGTHQGLTAAGDINLAKTSAGSNATVGSTQDTSAQAKTGGAGGVVAGAVSGNYTSIEHHGTGQASPTGSYTDTTATQTNVGGTVAGGGLLGNTVAAPGKTASGSAGGGQSSTATGGAAASASTRNLGGTITVQTLRGHGSGPR